MQGFYRTTRGRMNKKVCSFYDQLTPFYHLIYPDWEKSVNGQGQQLHEIITQVWGANCQTILDVACGIGTQSLGLSSLGYHVTASDISKEEIARGKLEASKRSLKINFSVADMRKSHVHHQKQFDLVIACDNAIPHLLNDQQILTALQQFYACTKPGGGCLLSVRDYETEEKTGITTKCYGTRQENGITYLIMQKWEFSGDIYDLSIYFIEDNGTNECRTHVMRSQYYAVGITKLLALMQEAGFTKLQRLDNAFFQPVLIGTKGDKK
jgi:SAM-dependent methyltransferase